MDATMALVNLNLSPKSFVNNTKKTDKTKKR